MSRLTYRDGHEPVIWVDTTGEETFCTPEDKLFRAICKLAHYEDLEEQGGLIEVVYGFNQYDHNSAFECSVCEFSDWDTLTADDGKYNYCPNCGAKIITKEEAERKLAELEGDKE